MSKLNSCPVDFGPLNFHGLQRVLSDPPTYVEGPEGQKLREFSIFRWDECSTCGRFSKSDIIGQFMLTQDHEPDKKLFFTGGKGD